MGAPDIAWLAVCLDEPVEVVDRARRLWCEVAGHPGLPTHLRVEETDAPVSGTHLDLHVDDVEAAVEHTVAVGATVVDRTEQPVLCSPAGFVLRVLTRRDDATTSPTTWPDGHRSRLDRLTVDVAHEHWETKLRFWSDLTGWDVAPTSRTELARLRTPERLPVRVLLQRRRAGATTGHVDVATDDREAEVGRLEALGLRRVAHGPTWTVMQAPHGPSLCVTDRDPVTGLLR